jgi:hypothetical protein
MRLERTSPIERVFYISLNSRQAERRDRESGRAARTGRSLKAAAAWSGLIEDIERGHYFI